jgi:CRISPR-associated protein Csx10
MALRDEQGLPELMPQVSHFGLDKATLEWDKTYLRFRHYSPYNAARKYYDQERQVIQKGSVISLTLDKDLTETQRIKLQTGIGDYRQTGLGRVLINTDLLLDRPPCPIFRKSPDLPKAPEPSHHLLVKWLTSQTSVGSQRSQTREIAEQLKQELEQLYTSARAYAAQPEGVVVGPGKTQWGRVSAAGKQGNDKKALLAKLKDIVKFNEKNGKIEDEVWATTTGLSNHQATFGDWLLQQLQQETDRPGDVIALLGRFADELIRKIESRSVTTATEIDQ